MTIHDFHSKLSSRTEDNTLFEALRRLRRLEDIRDVLLSEQEEPALGGWYPWTDVDQPRHAVEA